MSWNYSAVRTVVHCVHLPLTVSRRLDMIVLSRLPIVTEFHQLDTLIKCVSFLFICYCTRHVEIPNCDTFFLG